MKTVHVLKLAVVGMMGPCESLGPGCAPLFGTSDSSVSSGATDNSGSVPTGEQLPTGEQTNSTYGSTADDQGTSSDAGSTTAHATTELGAVCGNGVQEPGEACDDGNQDPQDACISCNSATCGDGFHWIGVETCDDGNSEYFDGCEPNCESTRVVALFVDGDNSAAMSNGGGIRNWGNGARGSLGYGNEQTIGDQPFEMPPANVNIGGPVDLFARGDLHSCVRLGSGEIRCWGDGYGGPLGYGNTERTGDEPGEMPPGNVDVGGDVVQLAAGNYFTCARMINGKVRCWGTGMYGELGNEQTVYIGDNPGEMPPQDIELGGPADQLVVGGEHACVLFGEGFVQCWGQNLWGQVGIESSDDSVGNQGGEMPPPLVKYGTPEEKAVQIAAGGRHTCVILDSKKVRCWGIGIALGQGDTQTLGKDPGTMPPPNVPIGGLVSRLTLGHDFSCALLESGDVRCWGEGVEGKLGYGDFEHIGDDPGEMPPENVNIAGKAIDLAAGSSHACALLDTGTVKCWGRGDEGQLGSGTTLNQVSMPPPETPVF